MIGRAILRLTSFVALCAVVFACSAAETTSPYRTTTAPYDSLFREIEGAIVAGDTAPTGAVPDDGLPDDSTGTAGDSSSTGDSPVASVDTVLLLKRIEALPGDISATVVIGPEGGEINLHDAGGKIVVPPGALKDSVAITMTARAGWDVAYEFEPHGLVFELPVRLHQDLSYTLAYRYPAIIETLQGSYYDTSLAAMYCGAWNLWGRVKENMKAAYDGNTRQLKFDVHHFSGYLVSSGFKGQWADGWDSGN